MSPATICVLGAAGSVGSRHARNALALGCRVIGCDVRRVTVPGVKAVATLDEALEERPAAVIVCTPPDRHYRDALAVSEASLPCLVEKPLTLAIEDAVALVARYRRLGLPLAVGYQLPAIPALRDLHEQAASGALGQLYAAQATFAYSIRRWRSRPATYTASIAVEASHELALLQWFLGSARRVAATSRAQGHLILAEIEFTGGAVAHAHLDGLAPAYRRHLTLYGHTRTLDWTYEREAGDQAYITELQAFLGACEGRGQPVCDGRAGAEAVRLMLAVERAGKEGAWVSI